MQNLDVTGLMNDDLAYAITRQSRLDKVMDAVRAAGEENEMTWLTVSGQRIAAIVPAGDADHAAKSVDELYAELTGASGPVPDGSAREQR